MLKSATYAAKAALMARFMPRADILAAAAYCEDVADDYPLDHPARADKLARAQAFRTAAGDLS